MASLYEINEEILSCVDTETGEIIDMDKLQELQMKFDDKVEGIALWIKNLLSEAAEVKVEKEKLAGRQKACENKAKNLKEYLSKFLDGQKFKTARVSITYRKSDSVEVENVGMLPEEFLRFTEPEVRKTELKKALKEGLEIEGATLVEHQNIQIK